METSEEQHIRRSWRLAGMRVPHRAWLRIAWGPPGFRTSCSQRRELVMCSVVEDMEDGKVSGGQKINLQTL